MNTRGRSQRTAKTNHQQTERKPSNQSSSNRSKSDTRSNFRGTNNNNSSSKRRRNSADHGNRSRNQRSTSGKNKRRDGKQAPIPPLEEGVVRIVPLGGVEEIGRNMTAIEYGQDIVVIDAGIQFTDEETPGIDYILPNTKYLEERKDRIKALVITHGHLDHIGGIPYIAPRIGNPPIYTREFGAMLTRKRQEEFPQQPKLDIRVMEEGEGAVQVGEHLKVRFFGLSHSIPDSTGIIIETPLGDIVNTGDVRVDSKDGQPSQKEVEQYSFFKDRNILLLAMDSTGIENPGFSVSEETVIKNIDEIVSQARGRLFIATFASQVERIIEFIKIAKKYNRKMVVEGRSMKTNTAIIQQLELVEMDHIIPVEEMGDYPPNQIMILATGAQGEEYAALMRIANQTHKYIHLTKHDTVVLSSSIIPGNAVAITKLKDNLYRHDPKIITYMESQVHASGHGKRGELEWIHKQIPYKFFMPVHGYHYMLKMHAEMSRQLGTPPERIAVPDNGSIIEIQEEGGRIVKRPEKAPAGDMVVEGFHIGDVQEVVIRDRKMLAEEGMFVIIASVNLKTGKLKKSPDIISRGFVYLRESQELLGEVRSLIKNTVEKTTREMNPIDFDLVKQNVDNDVSRFLFQKTAKKPIVIPVILGT